MSKTPSEGDILFNRFNLAIANSQRRLASLLGPDTDLLATTTASKPDDEDDDLKKDFADPEQLGVGGIRPKDIEDGSFTKRGITSNDKLLEQLIGKKRAKAHLAAKQQATRLGAQPQPQPKHGRSIPVKEESEDEEEGRAAAFKSKKRKLEKPRKPSAVKDEHAEPEAGVMEEDEAASAKDDESYDPPTTVPKLIPSRSKAKPTSYLDEILAERSNKKKRKKNKS